MILAELGKFVGAKVATALIFVAAVGGGIWCYQNPEALRAGWQFTWRTLSWLLLAAALPWSSYLFLPPVMSRQARMKTATTAGAVGVVMILAFTVVDIFLAFWLAGWKLEGSLTWGVVILGLAAAAVYNFVICESLARHLAR